MTTPPPQGNPFAQGQQPYGQPQGQAPYPPQGGYPQQPGQPGFPQQGGAAPFQGAPVPPPAPTRRVSKKVLRIVALIVVAIAMAAGKWYFSQSDAETTSVGSCMHNEGTQTSPDLKSVDCTSSDAQFEVVAKFDNTSNDSKCKAVKEAEIAYYQKGDNHDVVLCLKQVK
ncbi:hypothetical protein [Streptomyces sp. TRM68367]|uniref:LppU/SCO3897 family protein n=1 Tax=Streptomyces sp. TRM68367 TaxID=2758415 RepID=UPI00165BFF31|nr:hypothetical protein [Streptomyces sp. TRM68367]MBC9726451.1 hypothetical protein [Streptomyces sp. TRM68367]